MANYSEVAQYLRNEQCWARGYEGEKCKRPNVGNSTLARVELILLPSDDPAHRDTLGGNILCGGCSWGNMQQSLKSHTTPAEGQVHESIRQRLDWSAKRRIK